MRTKLFLLIAFFSFCISYAVDSSYLTNRDTTENYIQNIFYKNGILYVNGFEGSGVISVYSIIGNKIYSKEFFDLSSNRQLPINLKSGNMFIIQIHSDNKIKTFKIIA